MNLQGKTALVTGSVQRIGRQIALKLAECGADLIIHTRKDRSQETGLIDEIATMGRKAKFTLHDLNSPEKTERWFDALDDQSSGIDILINNACDYRNDTYQNIRPATLYDAMAVQVLSPLVMINALKNRGRNACVINILDARIYSSDSQHVSYHLAKRILHTLTMELALQFAPNITVNAVAPGLILPEHGKDANWLKAMAKTNPMQSHGNTDDVADAVVFLVRSSFITGQVIFVDGGRHLKGSIWD